MNNDLTRRRAIGGLAIGVAATLATSLSRGAAQQTMLQQPSLGQKAASLANRTRTTIHYELDFHASPQRFYDAILDQRQFAEFSGMPAMIDPTAGGRFKLFGGQIYGRNVEAVPGQRIVQAWRPGHWGPGVYSLAHFELLPGAQGTVLLFDHTGFPEGDYEGLDSGWHEHYWGPLRKYFG